MVDEVKRYLKITWSDADTDARVADMVDNAMVTLDHKLGVPDTLGNVYERSGAERSLFFDYCMYDWNDCLNEFDRAYSNEIAQLRQKYEVMAYKEAQL